MLILSRAVGKSIIIDESIKVTVVRVKDDDVRIKIEGPEEICRRIQADNINNNQE